MVHLPFAAMRSGHRGFTLLELLVAMSIMAMSLALLYRSTGESARNAHDVMLHQQAIWLADSVLASRNSVPPQGWQEFAQLGAVTWVVQSQVFQQALSGDKVVPLQLVDLTLRWESSRGPTELHVSTLLPQHAPSTAP